MAEIKKDEIGEYIEVLVPAKYYKDKSIQLLNHHLPLDVILWLSDRELSTSAKKAVCDKFGDIFEVDSDDDLLIKLDNYNPNK